MFTLRVLFCRVLTASTHMLYCTIGFHLCEGSDPSLEETNYSLFPLKPIVLWLLTVGASGILSTAFQIYYYDPVYFKQLFK